MPDIQTAPKSALVNTKILPTQMQRIWTYLKDHPGHSSRRITAELKILPTSISSLLSKMVDRDMVYTRKEAQLGRLVVLYFVNGRMKEYELLPRKSKKSVTKLVPQLKVETVVPEPTPVPTETKCQCKSWQKQAVDAMTVAEARYLYETLDKLFGRKS